MVVSHPGMMGQVAGSEVNMAGVEDLLVSKTTMKHPGFSNRVQYYESDFKKAFFRVHRQLYSNS